MDEYKGYVITVHVQGFATNSRAVATFTIRKGTQTGEEAHNGQVHGAFATAADIEREAIAQARAWIDAHSL